MNDLESQVVWENLHAGMDGLGTQELAEAISKVHSAGWAVMQSSASEEWLNTSVFLMCVLFTPLHS